MTLSDRKSHTNGCTDDHQSDRCGDACGIKYDEKECCCGQLDEDGEGEHDQESCVNGGHEISFVETDSYCVDWDHGGTEFDGLDVMKVQEKCTICGKIFQSEYTLTERVVDSDQEHQLEVKSK